MIKRFRHRGLERYFAKGTRAGIQAKHEKRIRLILARLHASMSAQDMDLPGLRLHPSQQQANVQGRQFFVINIAANALQFESVTSVE